MYQCQMWQKIKDDYEYESEDEKVKAVLLLQHGKVQL